MHLSKLSLTELQAYKAEHIRSHQGQDKPYSYWEKLLAINLLMAEKMFKK